ncbi:MAG TPA: TIGR03960 family B12-binding radical SAM protein [Thermoanaerobaculaceae bacterium]|nr:TIGR03960 family B12-binding radical SAM protein [Thermoanaerobaculaceae bacterium]HRS16800.1 TIGR03960 family B12-binding radical SAM protein [Thermoanaerobaculaceae bacterium]
MTPAQIRAALDEILPAVERPGRYVGLEANQVRKPWESVKVRLLLAFPDEYGIGMSHQGTRILYHLANRRPDTLAERAFAPWPDMGTAMRARGVPLYSLESYHAATDFDLVGITLQSELNYINVPYLIDLAGLPRRSRERADGTPLVVGGGPCLANPEPVADFFDVLAIGDGEALLPVLLDAVRDARVRRLPRPELLRRLAAHDGFYVPSLYRWEAAGHPSRGGRHVPEVPGIPSRVRRVWVDDLDPADIPPLPLVPAVEAVQDRLGIEVARGCTRGCRFCQAGFWYRPAREHVPEAVVERLEAHVDATGYDEVSLLSLSSADYSAIGPLTTTLADRLAGRRVGVSLPSLRADAFSVELADAVSQVRKAGFTFAPETGSERLRRVINKDITNADMRTAAAAAFARGWDLVKLYGMLGLPTETDEDAVALADLAADLVAEARRAGRRRAEIKVSVNPFVPKAWTPFQWEPFVAAEDYERRLGALRERCRAVRGVRLGWGEWEDARLEAVLARGDRRMAAAIARAHDLGAVFDGWSERRRPAAWAQAFAETGIDLEAECGPRALDAQLPWDIVDPGVTRAYMLAEHERAYREERTPDCRRGRCTGCGIPGAGRDLRLASQVASRASRVESPPPTHPAESRERRVRGREGESVTNNQQSPTVLRARMTFAKTGDARWLSHRNVMDLLARALQAAGVPVRFTEGFNPHVRLSMGPALPLGAEGLAEPFEVELHAPLEPGMLSRANRLLPEGLEITSSLILPEQAPRLGKALAAFRLRLSRGEGLPDWPPAPPEGSAGVLEWSASGDDLHLVVNARQEDGPTPGRREILAMAGVPPGLATRVRWVREGAIFGSWPR